MAEDFSYLIPDFVAESSEHLNNIENDILSFEQQLKAGEFDSDLINNIFRAIHSIKGGASFIELHNIEKLSHKMEDILDLIRNRKINMTSSISNALLKSIDRLKELLDNVEESNNMDITEYLQLLDNSLKESGDKELIQELNTTTKFERDNCSYNFDVNIAILKTKFKTGYVFVINIDLINDLEKKGINPLSFVKEATNFGEILDNKININLIQDLSEDTEEHLPISILYFSPMEKDMVAYTLKIKEDNIIQLKEEDILKTNQDKKELKFKKENLEESQKQTIEKIPEEYEVQNIEEEQPLNDIREYITVIMDNEEYGIEILKIQEIIGFHQPNIIPNTPDYILGMLNLRGNVIPIFDLRKKFNMNNIKITKYSVIIVIEVLDKIIGIVVDSVSDIVEFDMKEVQEPIVAHTKINTEFLYGVGKKDKRMIILINLEKLFEIIFEEISEKIGA